MEQVLALENALTTKRQIPPIKSVKHKSWCLVKTRESVWFGCSRCQWVQCQGFVHHPLPGSSPKSPLLPARHSGLVPLSFPRAGDINSTEFLSLPAACIKTERGRPHPARRPGWPGNPGTRRCCRWRGRSSVHSQPGPSWAGAPLVRSVP